jgi:hypothetical protein
MLFPLCIFILRKVRLVIPQQIVMNHGSRLQ